MYIKNSTLLRSTGI